MEKSYNVIVIGGGHAGCEAAMAAANMGSSVLLVTMDMNKFAQMSCNPAVGGIAKGQIIPVSQKSYMYLPRVKLGQDAGSTAMN